MKKYRVLIIIGLLIVIGAAVYISAKKMVLLYSHRGFEPKLVATYEYFVEKESHSFCDSEKAEFSPIVGYHLWLYMPLSLTDDFQRIEISGFVDNDSREMDTEYVIRPIKVSEIIDSTRAKYDGGRDSPKASEVMKQIIFKNIYLPSKLIERDPAKYLPTRINHNWNEIYVSNDNDLREDEIQIHLISGFKLRDAKRRLSLTLTLRNDKTNQTEEITLPVYTF